METVSDYRSQPSQTGRGAAFILLIQVVAVFPLIAVFGQLLTDGPVSSVRPFFEQAFEKDPVLRARTRREPVNLELKTSERGRSEQEIKVSSSLGRQLENIKSIGILMATYNNRVDIISARLEFVDEVSGQVLASFQADPRAGISDNRMLMFSRDRQPAIQAASERQFAIIRICRRGDAPLAVWGMVEESGPRSPHLWKHIGNNANAAFVSFYGVTGAFDNPPAKKRFELLAAMWGISQERTWIILLPVVLGMGFWTAGAWLSSWFTIHPGGDFSRIFCALSAAGIFIGLGLLYATLIPPFQAPDEPDHFLTFANLTGESGLEREALSFANAGHFSRIKQNLDQHFTAADVGNPLLSQWPSEIEKTDTNRSPVTRIVWPIFAGHLPMGSPSLALFSLRMANVIVVMLSLFAALICIGHLTKPVPLSIVSAGPFLMLPTLCLYASAVSNYPFLIAGYILQSAALCVIWIGCGRGRTARSFHSILGCIVTCGLLLSMAGGDSGVFCVPFWGVLLPLVFLLRGMRMGNQAVEKESILVLGAAAIGTIVVAKVLALAALPGGGVLPEKVAGRIGEILQRFGAGWAPPEAFALSVFVLALTFGSFLMMHAGGILARNKINRSLRIIPIVLLAALAAFVIFAPQSQVPDIENPLGRISFADYLSRIYYSFAEGFGPGFPDLYTTRLFWGGFGWMEIQMPDLLVDFLRFTVLAGLVLVTVKTSQQDDTRALQALLVAHLLALAAFLATTAYAYYFLGVNLQGRYLLAVYLFVMVPAYEGFRRWGSLSTPRFPTAILFPPLFCLVCSVIHGTVLIELLHRYF